MEQRPWLDGPGWAAVGLLLLSFCVSVRQTTVEDGVVVQDLDYGAIVVGFLAMTAGFLAVRGADAKDDARRVQRLGLLWGVTGLAGLRAWAGSGFWPL